MPKYSTFKYGEIARYGRYDLESSSEYLVQLQNVPFRIKTIDSSGVMSSSIVQNKIDVLLDKKSDIRLKTNNGEYVYSKSVSLDSKPPKIRMRSFSNNGNPSSWVECSIGRILPAKKTNYKISELSLIASSSSDDMKAHYNRSTIIQSEIEKGVYLKDLEKYKAENVVSYRSNEPMCRSLASIKFEDILPDDISTSGIKIDKLERYKAYEISSVFIEDIVRYEMGRIKFE